MTSNFLLAMAYSFAAASENPSKGIEVHLINLLNALQSGADAYSVFMQAKPELEPFVNPDCLRWMQYELSVLTVQNLPAEISVH